jgi:trimethylamine--corrinoid protein Co-methyltransferase
METLLMVSLAGMTMCQSLGTLAFGMYGSPEMAVMCDEMVYTIKRIMDGFTVNDDTLALDVIRNAGFEGNFLKQAHTARHFRKEMFFPSLFRRQTSDEWVKAGSKSMDQVAHEKVLDILEKAGPIELPLGADVELERALKHAIDNHPA